MKLQYLFLAFLVFSSFLVPQDSKKKMKSFEVEWKQVEQDEQKGLPKSAFSKVSEIYVKAKSEENHSQIIKCVLHKLKYIGQIDEEAFEKAILEIQKEIKISKPVTKQILYSILGEVFSQYYQNNAYTINQRTETKDFKPEKLASYDAKKLIEATVEYYIKSTENLEETKKIELTQIEEILNYKGSPVPNGRYLRPTLYHFLMDRAINYFSTNDHSLIKPADTFLLNKEEYFSLSRDFIKLDLKNQDPVAYKFYALKLFQDFSKENISRKEILQDIELKRFGFVFNHSNLENKDEIYIEALERLERRNRKDEFSTEVSFVLASHLFNKSEKFYQTKNPKDGVFAKQAFQICEDAIERFPKSIGANNCLNLKNRILQKAISVQVEKNHIPNKPIKALLGFKNISETNLKIYKVNKEIISEVKKEFQALFKKQNYYPNYHEVIYKYFKDKKEFLTEKYEVLDKKDYLLHKTEIKIPELPKGDYLVLFSLNDEFNQNKNILAHSFIQVTNLSLVDTQNKNGEFEGFVLNRSTGQPLEKAEIIPYHYYYDNSKNKYISEKEKLIYTDKNGYFKLPTNENQSKQYKLNINFKEDELKSIDEYNNPYQEDIFNVYSSKYRQYENLFTRDTIFLDRAIYRPSQPIYYKGILIEQRNDKSEIKPNTPIEVYFYDVNSQLIATDKKTTNEFGTFSGSFTAPIGVLNGRMSIRTNYGSHTEVTVEEYKRPKFEVKFDDIKGTYKPGDKVKLSGFAKAFTGANIDNAKISYRVMRTANFPWWWHYFRSYNFSQSSMEIKNGELKTDDQGKFEIEFEAIPDSTVEKDPSVYFTYKIQADVTDSNGETRTSSKLVNIGYSLLRVRVDVPEKVNHEDKNEFPIVTENLNGVFEPSIGYITIHKLKPYNKALKPRVWDKPDTFIYSEKEFHEYFPNEIYKDENEYQNWEKESEVVNLPFNTEKEKKLTIQNLKNWKMGKYVLEIKTFDKIGTEVKNIHYFTVFSDDEKKQIPVPNYLNLVNVKPILEPNEKMKLVLGSSENLYLYYEISNNEKTYRKDWIRLTNSQTSIEFDVEEEHRGGFSITYFYVNDNHTKFGAETINVPYSNKDLKIEYETFRENLEIGTEEIWKLKISGKNSEKVSSEILATLYDASLNSFKENFWNLSIYQNKYSNRFFRNSIDFLNQNLQTFHYGLNDSYYAVSSRAYDQLNWFGVYLYNFRGYYPYQTRASRRYKNGGGNYHLDDMVVAESTMSRDMPAPSAPAGYMDLDYKAKPVESPKKKSARVAINGSGGVEKEESNAKEQSTTDSASGEVSGIKARSDFRETVFFYPHLVSDKEGVVTISFKMPDALTKWKFMVMAHTKDLKLGFSQKEVITKKDLMVVPNSPRFFREDDKIIFTTKINNLSDKDLKGKAKIEFYDLASGKEITSQILKDEEFKEFETKKEQSSVVEWNLFIPKSITGITYKVYAKSGNFTDGEELPVPVLTNRMLVTETLPLWHSENKEKVFKLEKLLSNKSTTLENYSYTLEYTSNPAWYAVQALPYIMEYPYECAEQIFSRFYANSLGSHIANANPKIKKVFNKWLEESKNKDSKTLLSNLEKNQELKQVLLEETPWLLDAKDESESKKKVAILFDLVRMSREFKTAFAKLKKLQSSNGGFAWFSGMKEDRYITSHIITGLAKLKKLGVNLETIEPGIASVMTNGVHYLDQAILDDYRYLLKMEKEHGLKLKDQHISYLQIQYLYMRSFFPEIQFQSGSKLAFDYYKWQSTKYWNSFLGNKIMLGMISISLHRLGEKLDKDSIKILKEHGLANFDEDKVPPAIIKSLKETSLNSEELGMYWKQSFGYYWYELPVETISMMIEVFSEVAKDEKSIVGLKTWLLKNKQTNDWKTTKGTTEAIYALLLRGSDWLDTDRTLDFEIGNQKLDFEKDKSILVEEGTGYFKKVYTASEMKKDFGQIKIFPRSNFKPKPSYGGVYWQYFENLDKITASKTPLKITKKVFLQENSKSGPVITPIEKSRKLKVGDLLKIRIEISVDREMEYIHLKDMRASSLEPTNVFSGYRWQDGLGYYETTRDTASHFFIDKLPKGDYVFEYPLRVTHRGDFSNGITSIQSMYAPEFSSNSEGIRIQIE